MKSKSVVALATGLLAIMLGSETAFAHGGGALAVSASQTTPGSTITVSGTKMRAGSTSALELRGALRTFKLGNATASEAGAFTTQVVIPGDAAPGQYSIVALAADGDVAGRANVTVGSANDQAGMEKMPGMAGKKMMQGMAAMAGHASAEPMDVAPNTTTAGWIAIIALIIVALAAAFVLLKGTRKWAQ